MRLEGDTCRVHIVWPGSKGEQLGIKQGMVILQINELKISQGACEFMRNMSNALKSERIYIHAQDQDGTLKEFVIDKM